MGCCASGALVHERIDASTRQQAAATRHQYIDPSFLVQILRTKQVRLLRAEYILEWIAGGEAGLVLGKEHIRGPLPCRQDLPEEAFVDVDALNEQQLASLTIIAVSYCWISQEHPDPDCYHLKTLGSLLRCFLKSSFSSAPHRIQLNAAGDAASKGNLQIRGAHFGAGDGRCVGVFLDWTGLFQDKPKGRRTPEENEVFHNALKTINIWYAHITTIVWMFTSLPAYVQRESYGNSGWTTFEASVASILTKGTDMLEITGAARDELLIHDACRLEYTNGLRPIPPHRLEYIQLSHDMMSRQSRVPALPDEFDSMIDGKVFTNGADKDTVVKPKYAKTFYDLIPSSPAMQYSGLGLTPDNVYKVLDLVSLHIKNLETLDLSANEGINLPIQRFAQLPSLTTLNLAITGVSGDAGALKPLVNLKHLDLTNTQVGGDVGAVEALVDLEHLALSGTQVTGDVSTLEALVNLTHLELGETQVTGDVGTLEALVKLTFLNLRETQVGGDVSKLRALVDLKVLSLAGKQVTGDVGMLEDLVDLTYLCLDGTQVTGDVSKLHVLGNLTDLGLHKTQVGGNVGKLRALVDLETLRLGGTQVCGDVGALEALVKLTFLALGDTQVGGDVSKLRALVDLKVLDLGGTQVSGDAGTLKALVNADLGLGYLDIRGTQVTGDFCGLPIVRASSETQVTGDFF